MAHGPTNRDELEAIEKFLCFPGVAVSHTAPAAGDLSVQFSKI